MLHIVRYVVVGILVCVAAGAEAQRLAPLVNPVGAPSSAPVPQTQAPARQPSAVWPVLLGSAAGVVGFVGGLAVGYEVANSEACRLSDGPCISEGTLLIASVFGALGLATGTHVGNARKGSLGYDMVVSVGLGAIGLALSALVHEDSGTLTDNRFGSSVLLVLPLAQLVGTVYVERRIGGSARD